MTDLGGYGTPSSEKYGDEFDVDAAIERLQEAAEDEADSEEESDR